MNEVRAAESIKKRLAPFLEKGFAFEYFHEKGGDSSCVYICRLKKGRDFFDWREVSGANEIHLVVKANGEFQFPNLALRHKKLDRAFKLKHIFKRPSMDERRDHFASLLLAELNEKPDRFFGITL